jgi:hypothetical protein
MDAVFRDWLGVGSAVDSGVDGGVDSGVDVAVGGRVGGGEREMDAVAEGGLVDCLGVGSGDETGVDAKGLADPVGTGGE